MGRFEQQLHTVTKDIQLSSDEKLLMREKVVRYMDMVPLTEAVPVSRRSLIPSLALIKHFGISNFGIFARTRLVPALLVAGLIISTSAGVSYAAESALPGDILYPVKVNMNEPVSGTFLFSEQARIEWLSQLAERRLEEASILTAQGRLDTTKSQEVTTRFEAHTAEIKARTEQLEMSDPASAAEASAKVATTLEAHEAILARLAVENDTLAPQASALVGQVRTAAKALARISEDAEQKVFASATDTPAAQSVVEGVTSSAVATSSQKTGTSFKEEIVTRMRAAARDSLDRAYALLGNIENQSSESAVRTKAHIDATEAAFSNGQELLAQGEYDTAYRAFKDVAADARTVSQLLDAETLFQIEILPPTKDTLPDASTTSKSIRENQTIKTKTHAEQLIQDGQRAILSNRANVDDDSTSRATNFLKEAKAFKLRGDIAYLTNDLEEAVYLYKQAVESAQRTFTILQVPTTEKNTSANTNSEPESSPDATSSFPNITPPPMLDVVQVHHSFIEGVHTYEGVFVTPTKCFTLTATAQKASTSPDATTLQLITTETDTNCPTKVLDEKPFSVTVPASVNATMTAVMLNGTTSKFVVIEEGGVPTSTSTVQ